MTLVWICWYFCIFLAIMLLASSTITVAPGGETAMRIVMGVLFCLSVLSGIAALLLRRHLKKNPDARVFKSKVLAKICIAIAAILTILLVFGVLG